MAYDILKDTFCTYCQHDFTSPVRLQLHVAVKHPGSHADNSIRQARKARR